MHCVCFQICSRCLADICACFACKHLHMLHEFHFCKTGREQGRDNLCQLNAVHRPASEKRWDHVGISPRSVGHVLASHACRVSFLWKFWRLATNCPVNWLHVVPHYERSLQPVHRQLVKLQQNLDAIIINNKEDKEEITVALWMFALAYFLLQQHCY